MVFPVIWVFPVNLGTGDQLILEKYQTLGKKQMYKGEKYYPSNYRPILLTCLLCKILEHIVASSLAKHFTEQDIFYEMQHGFREKRSCEMQLKMLIDELSKNMQMGKQTDLILLDLSKAFVKVAHEKLLLKLHHYGIRRGTLKWIKDFLDNRKQAVVINGINSDKISDSSGRRGQFSAQLSSLHT